MSSNLIELGSNKTERLFYRVVHETGLDVRLSTSIRSPIPVEDKHGEIKKTVTTPDFIVEDTVSQKWMYVEVTQGSGSWSSKAAQERVVQAAGVENYIQLTGRQIEQLVAEEKAELRKLLIIAFFNW